MKQYFVGVNKRSRDLILGLLNLGCTLMFYYHFKTMELNSKYKFHDGEWLLIRCADDSEINEVKLFLEQKALNDSSLEFKIIYHQQLKEGS